MIIKSLKNSKLYYGKWPYKIVCAISNARTLMCRFNTKMYAAKSYYSNELIYKEHTAFLKKFKKYKEDNLKIRVEGHKFSIFCLSIDQVEAINKSIGKWITSIHGPSTSEEETFMLDNGRRKILCDKIPDGRFKFRIYFRNSMNYEARQVCLKYINNISDKVKLSKSTLLWITSKYRNWMQSPFMYVEDEKTLSLLGLILSNNVQCVEEFILRDSINTQ